jgi:hypothetical protein
MSKILVLILGSWWHTAYGKIVNIHSQLDKPISFTSKSIDNRPPPTQCADWFRYMYRALVLIRVRSGRLSSILQKLKLRIRAAECVLYGNHIVSDVDKPSLSNLTSIICLIHIRYLFTDIGYCTPKRHGLWSVILFWPTLLAHYVVVHFVWLIFGFCSLQLLVPRCYMYMVNPSMAFDSIM